MPKPHPSEGEDTTVDGALAFEQLRDIYCGRTTYDNDEQWIENLDVMMNELANKYGLAFAPQAVDSDPRMDNTENERQHTHQMLEDQPK